ncbi:MAG TPA: YtxH domain-containing protein [Candidatus Hydrothermia bacterium]|nr:YtxH domain-containing protein [Candidatus Hydrothermae bacterium]MDD3649559.1 YtxH domain-containing protein [Candidatus Hydrothermia bacterium]MDD5573126.1 YtxH domain-containing protein [Candidatus Hydrothermia bacterium]HOK23471.1 YtxH domain-containing protein [Candidatus Hydrothermia bacterium]HOL24013.1 YtxH domain-containing protein [Candidatus Hydrothermia bacterium]
MKRFLIFMIGVGLGAIAVCIFTPLPGEEMRRRIKLQLKKPDIEDKISKIKESIDKFQIE